MQRLLSRWQIPLFSVAFLVISDQLTKWEIEKHFAIGESMVIIPGFFNLAHIQNRGAAFGFLADIDSVWIGRGFGLIAIMAIIFIFFVYRSIPKQDWITKIALILIGSGACGNLIDRFRIGSVTDFLLFYIGKYQWPVFNVADSCITVGVTFLAISIFVHSKSEESQSQ